MAANLSVVFHTTISYYVTSLYASHYQKTTWANFCKRQRNPCLVSCDCGCCCESLWGFEAFSLFYAWNKLRRPAVSVGTHIFFLSCGVGGKWWVSDTHLRKLSSLTFRFWFLTEEKYEDLSQSFSITLRKTVGDFFHGGGGGGGVLKFENDLF